MTRSRKWMAAGLAVALLVITAACGADGQADPGTGSSSTTQSETPTPTPTPTPEPTLPTEEPTTVAPSPSDTLQTNAWGDDPTESVETKVVSVEGYKADLNISIASPRFHTSMGGLDELDPTGQLRTCLGLAGLKESQELNIVTVRVVIGLYPEQGGRFTWPDDLVLRPDVLIDKSAHPGDEHWPCKSADNIGNHRALTVTPTKMSQSWFIFAMNVTPNNQDWAKPYPWSEIEIWIRQGNGLSSCKVGRKTKGLVVDKSYTDGCVLTLSRKS